MPEGRRPEGLEFYYLAQGLIIFSSLRANKNIMALASPCHNPILNYDDFNFFVNFALFWRFLAHCIDILMQNRFLIDFKLLGQ